MNQQFVVTLTGPDRIGFVERATGLVLENGGNVETSRMARLGGAFAILMLVTIPEGKTSGLKNDLAQLGDSGFTVTISAANGAQAHSGWLPFRLDVEGADHEGIIHGIARYLSDQGINIELIESEARAGSTSGVPLFAMTARVLVPPGLPRERWVAGVESIGDRMNVDVKVVALDD
jgi:glycine cleavage system transcriptional repressor